MNIFIDFDCVIFNNPKLIADLKEIFSKNGADFENEYRKNYCKLRDDGKFATYNILEHIECSKNDCDIDKLKEDLDELLYKSYNYIYDDFLFFHQSINKDKFYLVTFGDFDFQSKKIKNAGLSHSFKEIFITDNNKAIEIKKVLGDGDGSGSIFLDDHTKWIDSVKKEFPKITTIFVKRGGCNNKDVKNKNCDYQTSDLKKVVDIVEKLKSKEK